MYQFKSHYVLKGLTSKYKIQSRLLNVSGSEDQRNVGIRSNQVIYSSSSVPGASPTGIVPYSQVYQQYDDSVFVEDCVPYEKDEKDPWKICVENQTNFVISKILPLVSISIEPFIHSLFFKFNLYSLPYILFCSGEVAPKKANHVFCFLLCNLCFSKKIIKFIGTEVKNFYNTML